MFGLARAPALAGGGRGPPAAPFPGSFWGARGRPPPRGAGVIQSLLEIQGGEDADEPAKEGASEGGCAGLDDEPEERPEGCVAQEAEEVGRGLADANRARPAELMLPDGGPSHRR